MLIKNRVLRNQVTREDDKIFVEGKKGKKYTAKEVYITEPVRKKVGIGSDTKWVTTGDTVQTKCLLIEDKDRHITKPKTHTDEYYERKEKSLQNKS